MSDAHRCHDQHDLVFSLQVGQILPLGPDGVPSGFIKSSLAGPVCVTPLGLAGDAQADLSVHGGPEKAVYGYGLAAYALWQEAFPEHASLLRPGAFGENLTIKGPTEETTCLGDVVHIGTATAGLSAAPAVLQVGAPFQRQADAEGDDPQRPLRLVLPRPYSRNARRRRPGAAGGAAQSHLAA